MTMLAILIVPVLFWFRYLIPRPTALQRLRGPSSPSVSLGHELELRAHLLLATSKNPGKKPTGTLSVSGDALLQNEILQQFRDVVQETARQTIRNVARDNYSKDIVALWASAGLDENLMDEDEILSQLVYSLPSNLSKKYAHRHLPGQLLSGERIPWSLLSWTLYELSGRPDQQARVREEIQRGNVKYDSTPLLNASINESPPSTSSCAYIFVLRSRGHTIPLSDTVRTRVGEAWNEIPAEKGQMVMVSAYAYSRLTAIWGYNADDWLPERFLNVSKVKDSFSVGLHANF
ncbi:hypothetical protein EDD18DRAFT_1363753 [Armillaria luteobubalina]|uniref:Cytochrome P450 n=1 Tax=Armillaria luteobubalina TaxID=153913 RepID=A0AA39PA42_9AGAR|nr:hypothetical protein EDD18DRAFT_1363753 [Armillaria luteobubalina]